MSSAVSRASGLAVCSYTQICMLSRWRHCKVSQAIVDYFSRNQFLANHPLGLRSDQYTSMTKDFGNGSGNLANKFQKAAPFSRICLLLPLE